MLPVNAKATRLVTQVLGLYVSLCLGLLVVESNIYFSTVLEYSFEVLVLCLSVSTFCYFIFFTLLHFRGKYCTFYSSTFI